MLFIWTTTTFPVNLQKRIRFPTSYHNKAVIAEGEKPILLLRWEFFYTLTYIIFEYEACHGNTPSSKFFARPASTHLLIHRHTFPSIFTTKCLNTTYQNQGKGGEIVQGLCTNTTRALYGHYKGLVRTVQGPCSNDTKALNKSENLRIRTFSAYILLVCR